VNRGLCSPAYVNDILQGLLDDVCACLANTTLGQPQDCFISHTQPPDDCCDFLAIWIDRMLPTYSFPNVSDRVQRCNDVHRMVDVKLRLVRPCWPVVRDNAAKPFPTAEAIQQAAEGLMIDMNVIWCCVVDSVAQGIGCDGPSCLDVLLEELRPDPPRGGCAGMTMTLRIELEGCC
jgi:hypothetical protein